MLPAPSFVTANFVARPLGYRMENGWAQGDRASNDWFAPEKTFESRFDDMLREIVTLGFRDIDLWCAHLHWTWATPHQIDAARALLEKHQLTARTYPAWVMGGAQQLIAACKLCNALGIPSFAGHCDLFTKDRAAAVKILREHRVSYAIENHPEASSTEIFARLGKGDEDVAGVALDTGWCATRRWDPVAATRDFRGRIFAVHLKDVRPPRSQKTGLEFVDIGHETCRLGDGIAKIREVIAELKAQHFSGSIGIEHEPELFDPREDICESRIRVEAWSKAAI